MGGVLLATIGFAEVHHANRWLAVQALHFARLSIGSMWREHHAAKLVIGGSVHEEGLPFVARRVIFGHIECFEWIVLPLNFGISYASEAQFTKDLRNLTDGLGPVSYTHLTLPTNREV